MSNFQKMLSVMSGVIGLFEFALRVACMVIVIGTCKVVKEETEYRLRVEKNGTRENLSKK